MFEPKPTAVIDSGNGIQCLWRLKKRIALGERWVRNRSKTEKGKFSTRRSSEDRRRRGARRGGDATARQQGRDAEHRSHPAPAGHHQPAEREETPTGARDCRDEDDRIQWRDRASRRFAQGRSGKRRRQGHRSDVRPGRDRGHRAKRPAAGETGGEVDQGRLRGCRHRTRATGARRSSRSPASASAPKCQTTRSRRA